MFAFFEDVKDYVGFSPDDSRSLRELLEIVEPHLDRVVGQFTACIEANPHTAAMLDDAGQLERVRSALRQWIRSGLAGPHDDDFLESRWRIGRRHVAIDLPQRYMVTAMNVIRQRFHEIVERTLPDDVERRCRLHAAMDRLLDLELAIILEAYLENSKDRMARRERLASIGQLAGNVAHELRNPLAVIESSVYLMRKQEVLSQHSRKHLERIAHGVDRCGAIIQDLLELARNRPPRPEPVPLDDLLDAVLRSMGLMHKIQVEREIDAGLELRVDPSLVSHALSNLIRNAVEAYDGEPGVVRVCARRENDDAVTLEVRDRGPGFDPGLLTRVFEPLVTTRKDGVGLGLALVKNIVELHGGRVSAHNLPEGGARVRLRFPEPTRSAR